eukprot:TRINITY_DN8938_c0_g2_i4.p1 TRINITY_DN8938_c0_g2~~TRINITY_DN8938_c0_g2_i4.p1  ORF type:complete len:1454 (+),score=333.76 TRINITY_DN8938_c0_g2_i4:207-4568(+)
MSLAAVDKARLAVALCLVSLILVPNMVNGASVSAFGCADGTREDFTDISTYPRIAACSASWSVPGMAPVGATCNYQSGNSVKEGNPSACSVLDACAPGWHVCKSPSEVDSLSSAGKCASANELYLTQGTNALDASCAVHGTSAVRACGTGITAVAADSCTGASAGIALDSLSFPWAVRGSSFDLAKNLIKRSTESNSGGVMCCLNAGPAVMGVYPRTGSTTGGVRVTLTGTDLGTGPDDVTSVTIGGAPCIDIEWISSEKLVCTTTNRTGGSSLTHAGGTTGAGTGGSGSLPGSVNAGSEIVVTTNSGGTGQGLTSGDFTYISPGDEAVAAAVGGVSITGIKPSTIDPNGGTVLTIRGTGFNNTAINDISVDIGGLQCEGLKLTPEGYLTCTVPKLTDDITTSVDPPTVTLSVVGRGAASNTDPVRVLKPGETMCTQECGFTSECDTNHGECVCRPGWSGEDCSVALFIQSPLSSKYIAETGDAATFTVRLSVPPVATVKVSYRPSLESEAVVSPEKIVFNRGNWDQEQVVTIAGINDKICDGARAFALVREIESNEERFAKATSSTNRPLVLTNKEAAGTILNIFPSTVGMSGDYVYIIADNICVPPVFRIDGVDYLPLKRSRYSVTKARLLGKASLEQSAQQNGGASDKTDSNEQPAEEENAGEEEEVASTALTPNHDQAPKNSILMVHTLAASNATSNGTIMNADGIEAALLPEGQEEFTIKLRNASTTEGYRSVSMRPEATYLGAGSSLSPGGVSLVEPTIQDEGLFVTEKCTEDGWFGTGASCRPCPAGATCPGGSRAWPEEGYWTPDEESGEILRCPRPESCLGGPEASCAQGYEGDLCGKCIWGYYEELKQCVPCPTSEDATVYLVCDIILWCSLALCGIFITHQMLFSYIVMLVKSLQALAAIGEMGTERLPGWLQTVYSFLHLFSGDYSFLKPDCYSPTTVEEGFYNGLIYNIVIFLPLLLGVPLSGLISRAYHAVRKSDKAVVTHKMDWYKDRTVRCFIIFLSTVYLPVASRAVAMLSCQQFDDKHYLIVEPSHQCYVTNEYWTALVIASSLISGFIIAYPVSMAMYLNRNSDRMVDHDDVRFGERFNFLYEFYKPGFTTFWAIEFAISCLIACANSILVPHPKYQLSLCTIVFGMKLLFILWKGPFLDWITNSIQALLTIALMLAVNANYLLSLDYTKNINVLQQGLPIFVVIAAGLTVFGILTIIIWVAFKNPDDEIEDENYDSSDEFGAMKSKYDFGVTAYDDNLEEPEMEMELQDVEESIFSTITSFLPTSENNNALRRRVSAFIETIFNPTADSDSEKESMSKVAMRDSTRRHWDNAESNIITAATAGELTNPDVILDQAQWSESEDEGVSAADVPTNLNLEYVNGLHSTRDLGTAHREHSGTELLDVNTYSQADFPLEDEYEPYDYAAEMPPLAISASLPDLMSPDNDDADDFDVQM